MEDKEFLLWIHNRLVKVHGENENFDYMIRLRSMIKATPQSIGKKMKQIEIKILNRKLTSDEYAVKYATKGSAGLDLKHCGRDGVEGVDPITIEPGQTALLKSGIAINIKDPGLAAFIFPRSGLGHKNGIVLSNLTGVIDSDYQGEIKLSIWNRSDKPYTIMPYDRIAQMVFMPVVQVGFNVVDDFEKSDRGEGGFGSTGSK
jgi:dUTP pyrophosphatase